MKSLVGTGQMAMGAVAPRLAQLSDDVLFGQVWNHPDLSRRDRSLVTVATLVALNRTEQLPFHLQLAVKHGLTRAELTEAVTHLAFYAGWPCAASAVRLLGEL